MWSSWGSWENCSVTCGIGFKRRTRNCNYTGKDKKRRCKGHRGEMKNCDTKITCPVDGGWTSWVAWDCSVSCGGGIGLQKRQCTNPTPMFGGKKCEGPSEEDGKCNAQKCADQIYTLSPDTAMSLRNAIEKVNYNFEKREGSSIHLPCDATVIEKIYKEYPASVLFWTRNGQVLKLVKEKIQVSLTELSIVELTPEDSGVYLCNIRYASGVVKPLTIASIAVRPKKTNVLIPENEELLLFCNAVQLYKVYKAVSKLWLLNGVVYEEIRNTTLLERNEWVIEKAQPNMTGIWTCQVIFQEKGFIWTTNITRVKVLPSISTYLKILGNRKILLTIATTLFLTFTTVGTFFAYRITRAREEFMADFELWRLIVRHKEIRNIIAEDVEESIHGISDDEENSLISTS
ncbi:hypothetical protein JTE90_022478 [Oedothorax gibbosus]|uniref:Ig-like domain-containing protein n=1 Tax=Oedothorax gibbosus TaxID=931172 RepID=A0AAV6UE24_9ARAC|nr:hypothetical protein JTE90_022478 [Oedothorax gibbosus]